MHHLLRYRRLFRFAIALLLLPVGCGDSDSRTGEAEQGAMVGQTGGSTLPGGSPHESMGEHHPAGHPEGEPLRVIMQRLAVEYAGLSQALWVEDLAAVQSRAAGIAEHPEISEDEIQRLVQLLGGEMARFEAFDTQVHDAALRLRDAAARGQMEQLLSELNTLQRGCVGCHSDFQQRVRAQRID